MEFEEKNEEFEEKNEEFEGNMTRNLKEKHREFYTRDVIHRKLILFVQNLHMDLLNLFD
jgi:hypothetical protein